MIICFNFDFQQKKVEPDKSKDVSRVMTIEELNELTSSLNLDWLTIINNMHVSVVGIDELIFVKEPKKLAAFSKLLSSQKQE